MKDTKLKAHSCSALAVKKPKTQEKRRRRRQIKKLQWQLQWRGMGSKLEKGIKGKKKMKDFEHRSQSLGIKSGESQAHFSHILLPFLFPFSSCLYQFETSLPAKIAKFCQYNRYFFRYETRGLPISVHWLVRYISAVPAGTIWNWLPWSKWSLLISDGWKILMWLTVILKC